MLQLIQVGRYQMYRSIRTELRAWVENPIFKIQPNQPVYILCAIKDADSTSKEAHVEAVGEKWAWFSCPFEKLHTIHDYAPELNAVMRVHGEPK